MIIGFDDKTRAYHGPPGASIRQDRIEQILSRLTAPIVEVRYHAVDYRLGKVGKLEVLREARNVPYRVAESIGDQKRIEAGDIFVRHGSQVERPSDDELNALRIEAEEETGLRRENHRSAPA